MNADGSGQTRLSTTPYVVEAWSPEGTELAAVRTDAARTSQIVRLAADGSGGTTPVTHEPYRTQIGSVSWSRDGSRLFYFASRPSNDRELYSMLPGGTGLRVLTTNLVDDADPAVSPNGRTVAFSRRGAQRGLYLMRAGGGVRRLTHTSPPADIEPAWSPDGKRLAFVRAHGRHVLRRRARPPNATRTAGRPPRRPERRAELVGRRSLDRLRRRPRRPADPRSPAERHRRPCPRRLRRRQRRRLPGLGAARPSSCLRAPDADPAGLLRLVACRPRRLRQRAHHRPSRLAVASRVEPGRAPARLLARRRPLLDPGRRRRRAVASRTRPGSRTSRRGRGDEARRVAARRRRARRGGRGRR